MSTFRNFQYTWWLMPANSFRRFISVNPSLIVFYDTSTPPATHPRIIVEETLAHAHRYLDPVAVGARLQSRHSLVTAREYYLPALVIPEEAVGIGLRSECRSEDRGSRNDLQQCLCLWASLAGTAYTARTVSRVWQRLWTFAVRSSVSLKSCCL